jgi:hypothetical protein
MYRRGESARPGRFRRAFSLIEADRAIDEEIAHHLAMRVSENEAAGMSPEAARSEALRRFGDVAEIREETLRLDRRLAWRRRWSGGVDRVVESTRHAWQSLRRHPGLSVSMVGILSLGIAAASTMFAMLEGTLLHPLPFPAENRLVKLSHPVPGLGDFDMGNPRVPSACCRSST